MKKVIDLKNVTLASINKKYTLTRARPGQGKRLCTTQGYKDFKVLIANNCKRIMLDPPYKVMIEIDTYGDIDLCVKATLDSLQGICITNDSKILKLLLIKNPIKRGKLGSIKVWVGTLRK